MHPEYCCSLVKGGYSIRFNYIVIKHLNVSKTAGFWRAEKLSHYVECNSCALIGWDNSISYFIIS